MAYPGDVRFASSRVTKLINILSVRCSLAFAPYLLAASRELFEFGQVQPRVVRHGGYGLVIGGGSALDLKHQHRDAVLGLDEAEHFAATIGFRSDEFGVTRLSGEVVL